MNPEKYEVFFVDKNLIENNLKIRLNISFQITYNFIFNLYFTKYEGDNLGEGF